MMHCRCGWRTSRRDELREVHALEKLENDEEAVITILADVEDARNVLALQAHRRARLTQKTLSAARPGECTREDELQRNGLIQLEVMRGHDDSHAAGPKDPLDAVFASNDDARGDEGRASRVGHNRRQR